MQDHPSQLLTIKQAAEIAGVTTRTIQRWLDPGVTRNGLRRFWLSESVLLIKQEWLDEFLAERNRP